MLFPLRYLSRARFRGAFFIALLILWCGPALAECDNWSIGWGPIPITGKVIDDVTGQGIAGASVTIQDTNGPNDPGGSVGGTANANGVYNLTVNAYLEVYPNGNEGPGIATVAICASSMSLNANSCRTVQITVYAGCVPTQTENITLHDPNPPPTPVPTPIPTPPPTPATPGFVQGLYNTVLFRSASASDLSYWMGQLQAGLSRAQVAALILSSPEHRNDSVLWDYSWYLNRTASQSEISFWVGLLQQGASDEQVQAQILSSNEFFVRVGSTNWGYVNGLFWDTLKRVPSSAELAWGQAVLQTQSRAVLAQAVMASSEYRADLIDEWYQAYLNRPLDQNGRSYWLGVFGSGATDESVQAGILGSQEFWTLHY